jgi:hypothetical protein
MIHVHQSHSARDGCAVDDGRHDEAMFFPMQRMDVVDSEKEQKVKYERVISG